MMPTFLIIGTPKSGTTSIYHYLSQHPDIYMSPVKEPHFFAFENKSKYFKGPGDDLAYLTVNGVNDLSVYQSLFDGVEGKKHLLGKPPQCIYTFKRHPLGLNIICLTLN